MSLLLTLMLGSLVLLLIFVFLTIVTVSYSLYSFDSNKVNSLTDKIKPAEEGILNKRLALTGGISLVDMSNSSKEKAIKAATQASKAVSSFGKQKSSRWSGLVLDEFTKFRHNSKDYVGKLFSHLVSLSKPLDQVKEAEAKKNFAEKLSKKQNPFRLGRDDRELLSLETTSVEGDFYRDDEVVDYTQQSLSDDQKSQEATLGLVSSLKSTQDLEEQGLFEKRETKLLNKLQDSGMADYDIWLDLGDLYAKYGEEKKAKEIYALVLKHAQGEKLKEKATNKLIGL